MSQIHATDLIQLGGALASFKRSAFMINPSFHVDLSFLPEISPRNLGSKDGWATLS